MAIVDGQYAGTMHRTLQADAVAFVVELRRDLDDSEVAALHDAAGRYGRFLDLEPTLTLTPGTRCEA